MNPAFPAGLPFKMFHRVSDINLRPIDSGFFERAIHDFPSRTNEWFARNIFVIAWLLTNQDHRCALRPFTKDSLGRSFVQMTCSAVSRRLAHDGET